MKQPLCPFHAGTLRHLRDRHPHMDRDDRRKRAGEFSRQCCAYWLARGVPEGTSAQAGLLK